MLNRSRCIVIVPVYSTIDPACEQSLQLLEAQGYRVWRLDGGAAIDVARCRMATSALSQGYDEVMWIDSDIAFERDAVDRIRDHELPICGGIYPKKAQAAFSFHSYGDEMAVGTEGKLYEVVYAATGFLHVRREVFEKIQKQYELPLCNQAFGDPFVPYFMPQIIPYQEGSWYLAEDYSFCHRARRCGYTIWVDTSIRLFHIGRYAYSWEDALGDRERHDGARLKLNALPRPVREPWNPEHDDAFPPGRTPDRAAGSGPGSGAGSGFSSAPVCGSGPDSGPAPDSGSDPDSAKKTIP